MITLALLLHWLWPEYITYWGGFGIVGGILTLAGAILFVRGQQQLEKINPLPENSVEAVKEDLQWRTNRK